MGGQPLPPHPPYAAQQHYPQGTAYYTPQLHFIQGLAIQ